MPSFESDYHDFSNTNGAARSHTLIQTVVEKLGVSNRSMVPVWNRKMLDYRLGWDWFDGIPLTESEDEAGKKLIYPIGLNPIVWVSLTHASALFGMVPHETLDQPVEFSFRNGDNKNDESCKEAARVIRQVWEDSGGADILYENAVTSQISGGSVFKLFYNPGPWSTYPVRIAAPLPDHYFPFWDSIDKYRLHEGILGYWISPEEAERKYGVSVDVHNAKVAYAEQWTPQSYRVLVDGKVARDYRNGIAFPMAGPNEYGFVPMVYIPHVTRAGGYYGKSHVPSLVGLTQELNSRFADRGDKVKAQAFDEYVTGNTTTGAKRRDFGNGVRAIDLGPAAPGSTKEPFMKLLERSAISATGGREYTDDILSMIQYDSDTPAVAWGADPGSQRSSATLETLFYPLSNHIARERIHATRGYQTVNRMLLHMLVHHKVLKGDKFLELSPRVEWNEILPRERLDLVNEAVTRASQSLISKRQGLVMLSRGEDIDEHLKEIKSEKDEERKLQQEDRAAEANSRQEMLGRSKGELVKS